MFNECLTNVAANFTLLKYRYRGTWGIVLKILLVLIIVLLLSAIFFGFRHSTIIERVKKPRAPRIRGGLITTNDIRVSTIPQAAGNESLSINNRKSTILLFSAMTLNYMETYQDYIQRNEYYARLHNYSYELIISNGSFGVFDHHPTGMKVYAANELLRNQPIGSTLQSVKEKTHIQYATEDWLVFLDADAFVAELEIPMTSLIVVAERYIDTISGAPNAPCHFIGQDQNNIVNSGFFLIRNSKWSREFITAWISEFTKAETQWGIDLWVYDQGALMNTILHYAADLVGALYEDYCVGAAAHANKCYRQTLDKLGFPYGKRKFGGICLLPDIGIPYSFHLHNEYRRGELIRHQKGLRNPSNQLPVLPYAYIWVPPSLRVTRSGHIQPYNGTIISIAFKNSSTPFQNVLYMISEDEKKHLIPDWDTFVAFGCSSSSITVEGMEGTIPVSQEVFESLPLGEDVPSVHSTQLVPR